MRFPFRLHLNGAAVCLAAALLASCGSAAAPAPSAAPSSAAASAKPASSTAAPAASTAASASAKPAASAAAKPASSGAAKPAASGAASGSAAAKPAGSGQPSAGASPAAKPSGGGIDLPIGTASAAAPTGIIPVTQEGGFYAANGLNADIKLITGGGAIMAAMISGQVPVSYQGSPEVINAALGGADVVMFAGIINTIFFSIYTRPDITDGAQLKGKKIMYSFGGNAEAGARVGLAHYGLEPNRDVTPINNVSGNQAAEIAALQNGAVDAIAITPPFTVRAREAGMRLLVDDGDLGVEFQAGTFATTRPFLRDHRDTVVRFARAISQGIKYYKTNKEGSEKALGEFTKTTDQAELDESWQEFALKYTTKVPNMTIKGTQYVMDNLIQNPAVKDHKPEDFMDMSVIQQLKDVGLYQQLWGDNQSGV